MLSNSSSRNRRDSGHRQKGKRNQGGGGQKTNLHKSRTVGREAQLTDQPKTFSVSLRNGTRVDPRIGRALLDEFRFLLNQRPERFFLLRDLIQGKQAACDREELGELLLNDRNEPREEVRAVFLASYREAADGAPQLDDPFQPANKDERDAISRANASFLNKSKLLWQE